MVLHNKYLLLDAASCGIEYIEAAQTICKADHDSLYLLNDRNLHLSIVAPYIFEMDDLLKDWWLENAFGKAWGMIIDSASNFITVRRHFRKFLKIETEEGQQLYFRFYDPRVLTVFLPSCDEEQLLDFFGPVKSFLVENSLKEMTGYMHDNGTLKQVNMKPGKI